MKQDVNFKWLYLDPITEFPLGETLRAERNFSLSFLNSSTAAEITRQRKFPLRAQSSAYLALGLRVHAHFHWVASGKV